MGGGLLFEKALNKNVPNPFDDNTVVERLYVSPTPRGPGNPMLDEVHAAMALFAEQVWVSLGEGKEAEPVGTPPGASLTQQFLCFLAEPLANHKEKEFRNFPQVPSPHQDLPLDTDSPLVAQLQDLDDKFTAYLQQPTSAAVADDLKELMRTSTWFASMS